MVTGFYVYRQSGKKYFGYVRDGRVTWYSLNKYLSHNPDTKEVKVYNNTWDYLADVRLLEW